MARSAGGGSRGGGFHGGSSHHSSGGSRSGGVSGYAGSTRKTYSSRHHYRHCYYTRSGTRRMYYSDTPLTKTYERTPEQAFRTTLLSILPVLFITLYAIGVQLCDEWQSNKKLDYYSSSDIVFQDDAGVLSDRDKTALEKSLRQFGKETGVIPYAYITDNMFIDGYEHKDIEHYSMEMYYRLFIDENHFLIVVLNDSDWQWWCIQGDNTCDLIDSLDFSALGNRIQNNLYSGLNPGTALSKAFDGMGKEVRKWHFLTVIITLIIMLPITIIVFIKNIVAYIKYKEEYEYYDKNGYPVQPEKIKDQCDHCGAVNPNRDDICAYCGSSMVICDNNQ